MFPKQRFSLDLKVVLCLCQFCALAISRSKYRLSLHGEIDNTLFFKLFRGPNNLPVLLFLRNKVSYTCSLLRKMFMSREIYSANVN